MEVSWYLTLSAEHDAGVSKDVLSEQTAGDRHTRTQVH